MKKAAIYFLGLTSLVLVLLSLYTVFGDSVGIATANLISYTAVVLWFIFFGSGWLGGGYSLRERAIRQRVPRLLAIHCAFLVSISVIQAFAFSLRPRLPAYWLLDHGKNPSWFVSGLGLIFILIGTAQIYISRTILSRALTQSIDIDKDAPTN